VDAGSLRIQGQRVIELRLRAHLGSCLRASSPSPIWERGFASLDDVLVLVRLGGDGPPGTHGGAHNSLRELYRLGPGRDFVVIGCRYWFGLV
jgi:hypothetical protein